MSRSRKSKSSQPKSQSLALSEVHDQIAALKKDQQWFLKQIKRKRTELKNLVNQMQEIAQEMFQRSRPIMEKMMERDREIHQLFQEIFTKRKFGKKSRKKIQSVYESLQSDGLISSPGEDDETNPFSEEFAEEFAQAKEGFQEETQDSNQPKEMSDPPANQRKMRDIFLRLASRFHPDKVTDSETQEQYTAIMQEVNEAYQTGDFAKLLEIESKQHDLTEFAANNDQESNAEKQRSKLMRENELLAQQYEEIKQELRYLRQTPEGSAVTDYRRATKEGVDPIADVVAEGEKQLEFMTEIRDFVRDFRDQKMTIQDFMRGPDLGTAITVEDLEAILDEMFEVEFY
ncbi:heat shock protein DnaJ domain protein [Halothece sp. PCC 7418]|uniref:J domain-containing protein n=1 Tax=Halothece sp. (strain PCC 7418) TaxID=65093 RepID=UPI0002A05D11|nr:J domain-containing protein [Halothece sp. PCC 7418]AFZ45038.1 heat shock protein DnaJ domain protein [Halothece sp. PCC 7418]